MEQVRGLVEDLEGYERCVETVLGKRKRLAGGGRLHDDYKIGQFLKHCQEVVGRLRNEQQRREMHDRVLAEKNKIEQEGMNGFLQEKRRLVEYYGKYPDTVGQTDVLATCFAKGNVEPRWSGEERYGKYLDLHGLFHKFINLPGMEEEKVEYLEYLGRLGDFSSISIQKTKSKKQYLEYLIELLEYLLSFQERAMALDHAKLDIVEERFMENWADGKVAGWEYTKLDKLSAKDLSAKFSADQLAAELLARGAKAGGSPDQRAQRLALLLDPSSGKPNDLRKAFLFNAKECALVEAKVQYLVEKLSDHIEGTKGFITRKQTRTFEELQQEEQEEERLRLEQQLEDNDQFHQDDDDNDEDMVINNPLNLPLDFDGKPIPLWLYKLHGLGVEYKCEICGNYSYWGRKAFDQHFQQWRHQHGMRTLGIPNTKHFHDITKIDEARKLYSKLQSEVESQTFDHDQDEQFEDSQGNVLNKKTYLDLKRQGLL